MAFRVRRKKDVNAMRIGIKVGMTVLGLYIGGFFINTLGASIINGTASPFYDGLSLIGWTVVDTMNGTASSCGVRATPGADSINNCVTSTTTGTGVLAIIGIIAIAMLIFEFVDISY